MAGLRRVIACGLAALAAAALAVEARAAIIKISDRKFPTGQFCPLESRFPADLTFTAASPAARFTLSVDNVKGSCNFTGFPCLDDSDCEESDLCGRFCIDTFLQCSTDADCDPGDRCGPWNQTIIDNFTVVRADIFNDPNSLLSPSPLFEICYFDTIPPGHTTPGDPNAPSYDHVAAGPEVFLETFQDASALAGWTGDVYLSPRSAPLEPAAPADPDSDPNSAGLGIGLRTAGQGVASASRIVTGLTPGVDYVVFFWWQIASGDRLTMTIDENICHDADGDGLVACNGCTLLSGQSCGDCEEGNAHCTLNCTDADGDDWCAGNDCDEASATCNGDCVTDGDGDGVAFCRDTCHDPDQDGYGAAGGAGNSCLGADCSEALPLCNVSCSDGDNDLACPPADCNDNNPNLPRASEVNDCFDQQCPGAQGYGAMDELSGVAGFFTKTVPDKYGWQAQTGAVSYQTIRSTSPTFPAGCGSFITSALSWTDTTLPLAGQILYYLTRPMGPCAGSWGNGSNGVERSGLCAIEQCTNGADDDADATADCADIDCFFHPTCWTAVYSFTDTGGDDTSTIALQQFFTSVTPIAESYIFFEIVEDGGSYAWCSERADHYRNQYLALAPSDGVSVSGTWQKWYRAPHTGNVWSGPSTAPHTNYYGISCLGSYSWCALHPDLPSLAVAPGSTDVCETWDINSFECGGFTPWTLNIKVASTRMQACGF